MLKRLRKYFNFARNMGFRYVAFRSWYELKRRTGWLKKKFPTHPKYKTGLISLEEWKNQKVSFFFESREQLMFKKNPSGDLKESYEHIKEGTFNFFYADNIRLGKNYDWLTHPLSQYQYDINQHWTNIPDFSKKIGDIKYVWEKARFSYLLTVIRYDYHFEKDNSHFVFKEIEDFIDKNPINQGPHYRCSQEISIRLMNWLFTLYFYKNSKHLDEKVFEKILHSFYWQVHHVYENIHFSRIAVRNNHALTETLMLYLTGLLFPNILFFQKWKKKGKAWFEQEIAYQIDEDGGFIQYSHNYHRLVIQLFSWAFYLSFLNGESFTPIVYERAKKSLNFLYQCQEKTTGWLSNFGNNDGALFFQLNNCHFRDFRPQLNALYCFFNQQHLYSDKDVLEDVYWYNSLVKSKNPASVKLEKKRYSVFSKAGYYTIHDEKTLTFIRCGSHKNRPLQADNLHLDIWYQGENILRDAGTYSYNTSSDISNYFSSTKAHNTASLGAYNQMEKGTRFIWFYWTQAKETKWTEYSDHFEFKGNIHAFKHIDNQIMHHRVVRKYKNRNRWEIIDNIQHSTDLPIYQYWNVSDYFTQNFVIEAKDKKETALQPTHEQGWYSPLYGKKEKSKLIIFSSTTDTIKTVIEKK